MRSSQIIFFHIQKWYIVTFYTPTLLGVRFQWHAHSTSPRVVANLKTVIRVFTFNFFGSVTQVIFKYLFYPAFTSLRTCLGNICDSCIWMDLGENWSKQRESYLFVMFKNEGIYALFPLPLWYEHYFELKATETLQLTINCYLSLKECKWRDLPIIRVITRNNLFTQLYFKENC